MNDQELLTIKEVRAELREEVSIQTLRRNIKNGKLRAIKPGRSFLIRRQWLNDFIDRGSQWLNDADTNTSSGISGSANGRAARPGTSCGPTGNRAGLSDYQRAQTILARPSES